MSIRTITNYFLIANILVSVSPDNILEWVFRIFIECLVSFCCLYGILSKRTHFMEPWMYMCGLATLWSTIYTICVAVGIEDSGYDFSVQSFNLYFAILSVIIALNIYKLNGFYSLYRQIKSIKSQARHQIFYDNENEHV